MDKSWLPSKKLVLSFTTLTVLLLGIFVVSEFFNKKDAYFGDSNIKVAELRGSFSEKDTDGDGLMDWEESLWNTDINKSDTDGDGTNDNDEIIQKRNPAIAGPDDLLPEDIVLNDDKKIEYLNEENLTETDKLSRNFLVDYLSMKKSGTLEENKENLVEYLSQDAMGFSKETLGKFYTNSDINIIEDNTKTSLEKYKRSFINIMTFSNKPSQDFTFFKNALQNKSETEISKLDTVVVMYEGMMNSLLKMEVPSSLEQSHLIIVNSFDDMIESTKKMRNVLSDPVNGLSGMSSRIAAEEVFLLGLNRLNTILEK